MLWFGMFVAKLFIFADGMGITATGFGAALLVFLFLGADCCNRCCFPPDKCTFYPCIHFLTIAFQNLPSIKTNHQKDLLTLGEPSFLKPPLIFFHDPLTLYDGLSSFILVKNFSHASLNASTQDRGVPICTKAKPLSHIASQLVSKALVKVLC